MNRSLSQIICSKHLFFLIWMFSFCDKHLKFADSFYICIDCKIIFNFLFFVCFWSWGEHKTKTRKKDILTTKTSKTFLMMEVFKWHNEGSEWRRRNTCCSLFSSSTLLMLILLPTAGYKYPPEKIGCRERQIDSPQNGCLSSEMGIKQ